MKEKSFDKHRALINAALREFTRSDYENASLNTIIKKAGISKGSFYYHFKDKEDLFLSLLEESSRQKMEFILSRQAALPQADGTLFGTIKRQARLGAEFAREYPLLHQLGKAFVGTRGTALYRKAKKKLGQQAGRAMEELVRKAVKAGEIDARFSPGFVVNILTMLIMRFDEIFNAKADQELDRMVDNLNMLMDFMRTGLENRNRG